MEQVNTEATTLRTTSRRVTKSVATRFARIEPSRAPPTPRKRTTLFSESKPTAYGKRRQEVEEEMKEEEEEEEHGEEEEEEEGSEVVGGNEVESQDGESEAEEFQPSADESDEYVEEDEDLFISRERGGNARAAMPGAPSSRAGSAVANNDDSERPNSSSSDNIPPIQPNFVAPPDFSSRRARGRRGAPQARVSLSPCLF